MSELTAKIKHYDLIDAMRLIAAFFVVTIHIHFPGNVGNVVIAIARFAVPFFFMVSGFFCYYKDEFVISSKIKNKIKHITILTVFGISIYLLYGILLSVVTNSFTTFLKNKFSFKAIFEFIFFNNVRISEFLWFLPALLYVYIAFYIIQKIKINRTIMFALVFFIFLLGIALKEFAILNENAPSIIKQAYFQRNWLFDGLPFFVLGYYIRINEEKLVKKLSTVVLILLMAVGSAEAVAVDMLHSQKSFYIGTAVAAFALFIFIIKYENNIKVPGLASLGAKYSLYIYIFHIAIRDIFKILLNKLGIQPFYFQWFMPSLIFIIALILSVIYCKFKQLLSKKYEIKKSAHNNIQKPI